MQSKGYPKVLCWDKEVKDNLTKDEEALYTLKEE